MSPSMLQPELLQHVRSKLAAGQVKQARYYNRTARPLYKNCSRDRLRMKLPGDEEWSLGKCKQKVAPRYYI